MRALALFVLLTAACAAREDVHVLHKAKLGVLTCSLCHVPEARGSVVMKKPGHEQCKMCHAAAFQTYRKSSPVCAECHGGRPAGRVMLSGFSHPAHVDGKARRDAATGFRADCSFCHKIGANALEPAMPSHVECATCHSRPGIRPRLSASMVTSECGGCHAPEHPEFRAAASGARFSHVLHFRSKEKNGIDCTTCHSTVAALPTASQCAACHQVMRPVSHTARWKDDIHGQFAAMDRLSCATCHVADYCIRCHNELPRSHMPLPLFKAGGHARPAMLNQRACMTCHTFESTCGGCHAR